MVSTLGKSFFRKSPVTGLLRGGFKYVFFFTPKIGEDSNLTIICFKERLVQPPTRNHLGCQWVTVLIFQVLGFYFCWFWQLKIFVSILVGGSFLRLNPTPTRKTSSHTSSGFWCLIGMFLVGPSINSQGWWLWMSRDMKIHSHLRWCWFCDRWNFQPFKTNKLPKLHLFLEVILRWYRAPTPTQKNGGVVGSDDFLFHFFAMILRFKKCYPPWN